MVERKGVDVNMETINRFIALAVITLGGVLLTPGAAQAQEEAANGEYLQPSPLEDGGAVVRRKLLFRSTRFEAAPLVGFTLADPFNRNIIAGANLGFHLTNSFGIGGTIGAGVVTRPTSLRTNIETTREGSDDLANLAFSKINFLASVEGTYVPIFGKFTFLNRGIINYDLHLILGAGFVGRGADAGDGSGATTAATDALSGGTAAGVVGVGGRFYANDFVSINLQVRDYIFSTSQVSLDTIGEPELRNNLMLSFGASLFFPTAVKVSR
jgi:outer membrane beta-barrel protein